jgi:hypothetical protein
LLREATLGRSGGFVAPNDHGCDGHPLREAISSSAIAERAPRLNWGRPGGAPNNVTSRNNCVVLPPTRDQARS